MPTVYSFDEIKEIIERKDLFTNLLLGNGFSIGAFPNVFNYKRIFENADFVGHEKLQAIFDRLGTHDFETVISQLVQLKLLSGIVDSELDLDQEIEFLKDILIKTISASHPDKPSDIPDNHYEKAKEFIEFFRSRKRSGFEGGRIFTLSYDLLLYWIINKTGMTAGTNRCVDGFSIREEDNNYMTWDGEGTSQYADIWFLHGALHIFDTEVATKKNTWNLTEERLIDQTREALDAGYFPIFVAEGTSAEKLKKIRRNPYLYTGFRLFSIEMSRTLDEKKPKCLVIFGHSFDKTDNHIFKEIVDGKIKSVFVSIYGDPNAEHNKKIFEACSSMAARSNGRLEFTYFDASTVGLWT